ncbi:MAG: hypothetical protein Tp1100MES1331091_6 [Prokaryotic dsDNA virus sp.]|nr:MAG: hypothetical protein Tp1100MES1331091_6 [Prokaryotic dsDNA virus sp.]|tara:strand:- start:384 stop:533 length:150 start_codon:yes stop_codon:yes gene_type:complete
MSLSSVVYARYLSGFSAKEISEELTIPEGHVSFIIMHYGIMLKEAFKDA